MKRLVGNKYGNYEMKVRRLIVFVGLFSFVFFIFAFTTFLIQESFGKSALDSYAKLIPLLISVVIVVFLYEPLRRWLVNLTNEFLFQTKYDSRTFLKEASTGIAQIKSLKQLFGLAVHFLTMRLEIESAAILTFNAKDKAFYFAAARGYGSRNLTKSTPLTQNDPLIDYLSRKREVIDLKQIKLQRNSSPRDAHYDFRTIEARLVELDAACCIPSYFGGHLKNILVLGKRKSGHPYLKEDLDLLFSLAQESAMAIENARLYDEAVEKAEELEVINDQLNTAQTNLLRALDDTEVANKRLKDTHAQLIHEQKMATLGRLASSVGHEVNNPLTILSMNVSRIILKYRKDPDLKVSELLDTFQKMEQNISRIKAVVNTLTGLLKKSERGKFEPLSLKLILEETLPLVQFQTYLENLSGTEVTFDIPANLPLIKGDLERLQEVFLNLFINSYHAMVGKKDRKITVSARESPAHPGMVLVEFSDNGCGMSDEVMKKAFTYGFTTKPAGKGSGMGLYMCRYIIELHGGGIKVRSNLGEGTTFVITLPVYHEFTPAIETTQSGAE